VLEGSVVYSSNSKYFVNPGSIGSGDTMRQQLLSNENLNRIGRRFRIEKLLVLSPGAETASDYMVATMLEAVVGAVYLDGGMEAVEKLMTNLGVRISLWLLSGETNRVGSMM
jgi:Ribonuclease-III-like